MLGSENVREFLAFRLMVVMRETLESLEVFRSSLGFFGFRRLLKLRLITILLFWLEAGWTLESTDWSAKKM